MRYSKSALLLVMLAVGCDEVSTPGGARNASHYEVTDQSAYARLIPVDNLGAVEDSLIAVALGRFTGEKRERIWQAIRPSSLEVVVSAEDSIAADAISRIHAIRLRRARLVEPPDARDAFTAVTGDRPGDHARMLATGKVPIAIAVRNEGDSAEEIVIGRRRSLQPHDIVVLPAAALNDVGVRSALGAVMAVHARVGVCPEADAVLRVRGGSRPSPVRWTAADTERAASVAARLDRSPRFDVPGMGSIRSTTVWTARVIGQDIEGPRPPRRGVFTSVCEDV